jgi:hypothetical protein
VHALAGERVEIGRERGDQRLALAGLHLGDLAVVEHHAADQLHVEVAHAQRALGSLAHHRERLGQQLVEARAALGVALLQLLGLAAQLGIGQPLHVGLERVDPRHHHGVLLEQALVAAAEYPCGQDLEKLERAAKSLEKFGAHLDGPEARRHPPDPQKPLILSGNYLARACADAEFDTRNFAGFCAEPR